MHFLQKTLTVFAGTLLIAGCGVETEPKTGDGPKPIRAVQARPSVWTAETSVGLIVADRPEAARVFELVGIDYCCGGEVTLGDAAEARSIDVGRLLGALSVVGSQPASEHRDWQREPLPDLMDHIVATHHVWLRRELPRTRELVDTVSGVHGDAHPELAEVRAQFRTLHDAIGPHLDDEEKHVFPAIAKLVDGERTDDVEALLGAMRTDHDGVGEALHRIRDLTDGYAVPDDACQLYREMLTALEALEHDLHQHVHLENNVLLPRALAELDSR